MNLFLCRYKNGGMEMGKKKSNKGVGSIFKRFIGNRNTVTLLGIAACIVVLVVGYNYRVNQAISPTTVPYAKQTIPARTLITDSMVGQIKITTSFTGDATNLVKTKSEVVNMYASYKTAIPKGSLFYKEQLTKADAMPDAAFANIEDGYTIYSLDVSLDETYANSIRAGDYIDLYMSTKDPDNDNMLIYTKFIESIRVLAVKDSQGNNILKNSIVNGKPAELLFAVKDEMYLLLMQAGYLSQVDIRLEPVIRNKNYTNAANETLVSSEYLTNFIKSRVAVLVG